MGADYIGAMGLDLKDFTNPLSQAKRELAQMQVATTKGENSLKLLEKKFKDSGSASKIYEKALTNQRVVVNSLKDATKSAADNVSKLQKAASESGKSSDEVSKLGRAFSIVHRALYGVGAFALVGLIKSVVSYGAATHDAALKSDASSESFQRTTAALSKLGVGADDANSSMHAVATASADAKAGGVETTQAFESLGVSFRDLQTLSPDEILRKIADHASGASNKTDELRKLSALFGNDLARILLPALEQGGDAIKNFGDEAAIASQATTDAANQAEKDFQRWGNAAKIWAAETINALEDVKRKITGAGWLKSFFRTISGYGDEEEGGSPSTIQTISEKDYRDDLRKNKGAQAPGAPATGKASGAQAYSAPTGPPLPQAKSMLDIQREQLQAESEIANRIAPEVLKQKDRLLAEETAINDEITFRTKIEHLEASNILVAGLLKRKAINAEAQRAADLAIDLYDAEINLQEVLAERGVGYAAVMTAHDDTLKYYDAEIRALDRVKDKERIATIQAQKRSEVLSMLADSQRHEDELRAADLQLTSLQAQKDAQLGLVKQAELRAQYEQRIVDAYRIGNTELAKSLESQQKLAERRERAEEHDITPQGRLKARREERITTRKAKQEEARETELIGRADRGAGSLQINEQLGKDRLAQRGEDRKGYAQRQFELTKQSSEKILNELHYISQSSYYLRE